MGGNEPTEFLLRLTTVHDPPYNVLEEDDYGELHVTGIIGEFLTAVQNSLNYSYVIRTPPSGGYGTVLPNGTATGMAGMIARKDADVILTLYSLSWERFQVVDYMPVFGDDLVLLMSSSSESKGIKDFGDNFKRIEWKIWALYLLILGISFIAYVIDDAFRRFKLKISNKKFSRGSGVRNQDTILWGFICILVNQCSPRFLLSSVSSPKRIILICFTFFVFFFNTYFTGELSTQAVVDTTNNIDSVEDLLYKSDSCPLIQKGTLLEHLILSGRGIIYEDLRKRMSSCGKSRLVSLDVPPEMITSGKFVFIYSEDFLVYLGRKACEKYPNMKLHFARTPFSVFQTSIAIRKDINRDVKKSVAKAVQRVISSGLMLKWISDKRGILPSCFRSVRINTETELTLGDLESRKNLFLVWMTGAFVSIAIFLIEILAHAIGEMKKRAVVLILRTRFKLSNGFP